jgi:hypothetical protein
MDEIDREQRQEESTIIRGTTNVTLRDYFAAKAMLGMYAAGDYDLNQEERARVAYQMADEMLFIRDTE